MTSGPAKTGLPGPGEPYVRPAPTAMPGEPERRDGKRTPTAQEKIDRAVIRAIRFAMLGVAFAVLSIVLSVTLSTCAHVSAIRRASTPSPCAEAPNP